MLAAPPKPMSTRAAPHYLRFVRAMAFVSVALPVPIVFVSSQLAACGGTATTAEGVQPGPNPGTQAGPPTGTQPGPFPGVAACPDPNDSPPCNGGGGVRPAPEPDSGLDASNDGADANVDGSDDGGGPSRGTPELPASWLA